MAQGKIPDCTILSNKGFSEEEVTQLEAYMQRELPKLKEMAAGFHLLDAMVEFSGCKRYKVWETDTMSAKTLI